MIINWTQRNYFGLSWIEYQTLPAAALELAATLERVYLNSFITRSVSLASGLTREISLGSPVTMSVSLDSLISD